MERRETGVKVENTNNNTNLGSSMFYPDHVQISASTTTSFPLPGFFEYSLSDQAVDKGTTGSNSSSLGFMELLGLQDYGSINPSSLLDMVQAPYSTVQLTGPPPPPSPPCTTTSRTHVLNINNQPGTPISSSISSASSEALNDETQAVKGLGGGEEEEEEEGGAGDEQEEHKKTKTGLRPKKSNQKKQKEPRFAFMTKSEVDHLEDGYRWRKYGQKAVKNSPFPRSYYRCTTASCNVKKRVERSFTDPSIVVTTYEGQHNHHSPVMARPAYAGASTDRCYSTTGAFSMPMQTRSPSHHHQQQHLLNPHSLVGVGNYNASTGANARLLHERLLCTPQGSSQLKDHGLLQDLLPYHIFKEEF